MVLATARHHHEDSVRPAVRVQPSGFYERSDGHQNCVGGTRFGSQAEPRRSRSLPPSGPHGEEQTIWCWRAVWLLKLRAPPQGRAGARSDGCIDRPGRHAGEGGAPLNVNQSSKA